MDHPLLGALLRTKWARLRFRMLQDEIAGWPAYGHAIEVTQQFDPGTDVITITVQSVPRYPSNWGMLASEAYFHLRNALDYTAWELAKWSLRSKSIHREPSRATLFPVAVDEQHFAEDRVKDIRPEHVAIIKRLQPYSDDECDWWLERTRAGFEIQAAQAGHPLTPGYWSPGIAELVARYGEGIRAAIAAGHPLMKLVEVNNSDKHRALLPVATKSSTTQVGDPLAFDCVVTDSNYFVQITYEVGAKLAEFNVVPNGPQPRVLMSQTVLPRVAFGQVDVLGVFDVAFDRVRNVIRTFWPVFT